MNGDEEHNQITDSWLEIFNYGTLPFYWGQYEKVEGEPNRDALMRTAQYLKSKGVTIKAILCAGTRPVLTGL